MTKAFSVSGGGSGAAAIAVGTVVEVNVALPVLLLLLPTVMLLVLASERLVPKPGEAKPLFWQKKLPVSGILKYDSIA